MPKKNWRSAVGRFIRSDLKKQGASWPPKTDSEAVKTTFTFSPSGVEFHYPPYAVGSYAEGYYHVLVPYSVLRPVLEDRHRRKEAQQEGPEQERSSLASP